MLSSKRIQSIIDSEERNGQGPLTRQVTIGNLSNEVLLDIFFRYMDASPQCWPKLVHVCHKWRHIVFGSPQGLRLRLYCTHGTPVSKSLNCWPPLPIVVHYGGSLTLDPPAPEDEDNIVAALMHSDRVISIILSVTRSLRQKLGTIEEPFSELENLVLLSGNRRGLVLPNAFGWGTHLRSLHLTRIASPALPQLLSPSLNLVDLQLHEIPYAGYFLPNAFANALSGMTQLQSLSLHFHSLPSHRNNPTSPPSGGRFVLPALTYFNYRGTSTYLDSLAARIDAPFLWNLEITFFHQLTLDVLRLSQFIDRIEVQKSSDRADILISRHAISITFTRKGTPARLRLQVSCEQPDWQLSSMARICHHFSALLVSVEDLHIDTTQPSSDDAGDEQWLELIQLFSGAKGFLVSGNYSTNVARVLPSFDRRRDAVLPALNKLYISQPGPRNAPLRVAVVSFMVSRRLSGRLIQVEYEQTRLDERSSFSWESMAMLSDDIFLNIVRHYLDDTPRNWATLAWVCQRWRQIIFTSPLGLDLRLYSTYGTPVLKTLNCWPPLPLVLNYGGSPMLDPPTSEDDDNIIAALKQSGRVRSISLTVTSSLLEKLSAISEPFSELEELVLLSRGDVTLPSAFRWGPRLRTLHSTRIAFPSLPQHLPTQDLVDLQLHEIPSSGYFSPDAFANALSEMTQLQTLSLHFLSLPSRRNSLGLPPPSWERVVLPALTCLKYRGTSKYLDSLVAKIEAPRLGVIDITFFGPTMDTSQLGRFIERTEMQTLLSQADIQTSADVISISLTNSSSSTSLRLKISCNQLDWQLSAMAQVCDQFSSFLFRVENLGINTTQSPSGQDDVDGEQWLDLIRSFGCAQSFLVAGELTTDILCALRPADLSDETVLTSLHNLRVRKPLPIDGPFWDSAQSFIAVRQLLGRPVMLQVLCPICDTGFTDQPELNAHLVAMHECRMCSYCDDFEIKPEEVHQFREHLQSKHLEVASNDPLVLGPIIDDFEYGFLVNRHSSLRARAPDSDIVESHGHGEELPMQVPMAGDSDTQRDPSIS